MAKKRHKKQPPPKRMTEQQRRARAKQDSAAIQGTPLTKRQQRAQARQLAAKPRSDALAAMSDAHLSPPPDKLKAAAPVVTTIRRGASGVWTAPTPHVQQEKVKAMPVNRDSAELTRLLDTLERSTTIRRAKHGKAKS